MNISRRNFLASAATAASATLANAYAAPYQVSLRRDPTDAAPGAGPQSTASGPHTPGAPLVIPSLMPMGSGAPLGGIGTGFIEIRADGCFHEWQIFNSDAWAQDARSTTAKPDPGPQYLRFVLRTKASPGTEQIRRLYLRPDEQDPYTLPFVRGRAGHRLSRLLPADRLAVPR